MARRTDWDPLQELDGIQKRMNDLFDAALVRTGFHTAEEVGSWEPQADVYETDEALEVTVELPGLAQDAISLRVDGDELVVEGKRHMDREQDGAQFHRVERSYGKFSRRFRLPSSVDRESVQAEYRGGVLRVRLENRPGSGPRAIEVSIR